MQSANNNMENVTTAYIGLGSNLGNRKEHLEKAIEMLKETPGIEVTNISAYINTAPVGYEDQPDFLNTVTEIKTTLTPGSLLAVCGEIEKRLKRRRDIRWGPRTVDLDILLYGDLIVDEENLTIPHPRMHEREFVLKPLSEIAPNAIHPLLGKTAGELYENLSDYLKNKIT